MMAQRSISMNNGGGGGGYNGGGGGMDNGYNRSMSFNNGKLFFDSPQVAAVSHFFSSSAENT